MLNSWEAAYLDINEKKLLQLAKAGKEAGIELFVMDDGWFGHRDNDRSSLGDWKVNTKKLPNWSLQKNQRSWYGFWHLGRAGDGERGQ